VAGFEALGDMEALPKLWRWPTRARVVYKMFLVKTSAYQENLMPLEPNARSFAKAGDEYDGRLSAWVHLFGLFQKIASHHKIKTMSVLWKDEYEHIGFVGYLGRKYTFVPVPTFVHDSPVMLRVECTCLHANGQTSGPKEITITHEGQIAFPSGGKPEDMDAAAEKAFFALLLFH